MVTTTTPAVDLIFSDLSIHEIFPNSLLISLKNFINIITNYNLLTGVESLELPTYGFGDRRSTN